MISTSDLIDSLVANAKPVRRLRSPVVRASYWLLFSVLILLLFAITHGVRPDLALKLRQPEFVIGIAAALATGMLAAIASFITSVPGRSRNWLLLPAPALAIWIATVGYGCITNWISIEPEGVSLGETARCFATLVLTGAPLSLLMLLMLRYAACLSPASVAITASLAVAAMAAVALSLLHPLNATAMVLIWNLGVAALLVAASGLYGRRLFEWIAPQ